VSDPVDPGLVEGAHTVGGLGGIGALLYLGFARFFGGKERDELVNALGEIKAMVADVAASVHELRRDLAITTERATAATERLTKAEEEIERLRERYHDLVSTVAAVKGRVDVIEERRSGTGEHRAVTP